MSSAEHGPALERLSLNQYTARQWDLHQVVTGCVRAGIGAVGLWRDKVMQIGLDAAVDLVRDAGLTVSSLCRGGYFVAADPDERSHRRADNRRAVDEAAALGADTLVLVCGGQEGVPLAAARDMVRDGVADLADYAAVQGVRLGIEPMHPMYCADRSVIVTLRQALDLAEPFPPERVGVVIDTFHLWWDPEVEAQIARAAGRIASVQLGDWLVPLPDLLMGRGLMGDGAIDFRTLLRAVDAAGYDGPIEVEIFNRALWEMPGEALIAAIKERFATHVTGAA